MSDFSSEKWEYESTIKEKGEELEEIKDSLSSLDRIELSYSIKYRNDSQLYVLESIKNRLESLSTEIDTQCDNFSYELNKFKEVLIILNDFYYQKLPRIKEMFLDKKYESIIYDLNSVQSIFSRFNQTLVNDAKIILFQTYCEARYQIILNSNCSDEIIVSFYKQCIAKSKYLKASNLKKYLIESSSKYINVITSGIKEDLDSYTNLINEYNNRTECTKLVEETEASFNKLFECIKNLGNKLADRFFYNQKDLRLCNKLYRASKMLDAKSIFSNNAFNGSPQDLRFGFYKDIGSSLDAENIVKIFNSLVQIIRNNDITANSSQLLIKNFSEIKTPIIFMCNGNKNINLIVGALYRSLTFSEFLTIVGCMAQSIDCSSFKYDYFSAFLNEIQKRKLKKKASTFSVTFFYHQITNSNVKENDKEYARLLASKFFNNNKAFRILKSYNIAPAKQLLNSLFPREKDSHIANQKFDQFTEFSFKDEFSRTDKTVFHYIAIGIIELLALGLIVILFFTKDISLSSIAISLSTGIVAGIPLLTNSIFIHNFHGRKSVQSYRYEKFLCLFSLVISLSCFILAFLSMSFQSVIFLSYLFLLGPLVLLNIYSLWHVGNHTNINGWKGWFAFKIIMTSFCTIALFIIIYVLLNVISMGI